MEVLKTNCGITGDGKRKQSKQGKKVIPVKRIINASESEENDENVPCSSISSSKKKMQQKIRGTKKSESIDDTDNEDIWSCRECSNKWHDDSSDHWIVCNQIKSNQIFISFYKFTLVLLILHYIYMLKN